MLLGRGFPFEAGDGDAYEADGDAGAPDLVEEIEKEGREREVVVGLGVEAALGFLRGEFGYMVAKVGGKMVHVPLEEVAGKLKYVDPESDLVREARAMGISFGDE